MKPPIRVQRGTHNIPAPCWRCWWKEAGRCFNDELGEVPTAPHTYTDKAGKEHTYTLRTGFEITDEHWYKCRANFAQKRADKQLKEAEGNDRRLLLLLEEAI